MDENWFRGFTSDLHSPELWNTFYATARTKDPSLPVTTPPVPKVDGEALFWYVCQHSKTISEAPFVYRKLTGTLG